MAEVATVNMFPEYSAEEAARIKAALDRRNEADYQAYMILRRLQPYIGVDPFDGGDVQELREEVEEVIREREDANDEFLRAIAKQPARRK